jgi:CheY-like chemotaxis protein
VRKRLLIVEDSELNSDLRVQLFEDVCEVDVAVDGDTAVELALSGSPDAGCDDFVAKPIDDLRLIELVSRLLERR